MHFSDLAKLMRPGIRGTELPAGSLKEGAIRRRAGRSVGFTGECATLQKGMSPNIAHIVINVNKYYANVYTII